MIRELFRIGSFPISPFGLMMVLAFVTAYLQLRWGLRKLGAGDEEDASSVVFAGCLGGIIGAKVYYAVLHHDWRLLFDRSGLVWYGGFLVAAVAILWVVRRRGMPPWPTVDAGAAALAVGYGVGRVGCFLVGDDYGVPTDRPWGVIFPHGLPPTTAGVLRHQFGVEVPPGVPDDQLLPVHPTQLYETALALAIWGLAVWMIRRRPRPGTVALTVIGLLAAERFAIEFLRAKDDRFLDGLTVAQAISLAIVAAVLLIGAARRLREPEPGAA